MELALNLAVAFVYGYTIILSLIAIRRQQAKIDYHPHQVHPDHGMSEHIGELMLHRTVALFLIASLGVRLFLMNADPALWLAITLTVVTVLPTVFILFPVWRMAWEDLTAWAVPAYGKVIAAVLLLCALGLWADQVWRVVSLFQ
ncbi:hypothetical protein [Glycomyces sp. NPDC048151]|uniref:hypothetical protein n=1 Tax=Glycomyces sp. NPDC048151 TaxID=3364002 RepID=UPI003713EE9D